MVEWRSVRRAASAELPTTDRAEDPRRGAAHRAATGGLPTTDRAQDPRRGDPLSGHPEGLEEGLDLSRLTVGSTVTSYISRDPTEIKEVPPGWVSEIIREEVCILVSDMSGFSRTVRQHGILHFASIIARKRQLCMPILKRRGAVKVLTEGDDIIALFKDVLQGSLAAVEMKQTIDFVNSNLDIGISSKFTIKLGGIGVHCGTGIIIDKGGNMSGEPFRGAYHLGEDACENGELLFSKQVVDRVRHDAAYSGAVFVAGVADEHFENFAVTEVPSQLLPGRIPSPDDGTHVEAELLPLARRYLAGTDIDAVDLLMAEKYMKTRTVLMFDLHLSNAGPQPEQSELLKVAAKLNILKAITPILEQHGGRGYADLLWIFENTADSLLAALAVRDMLKDSTKGAFQKVNVEVTGYGVHTGSLLLIEGTDVCLGDPVNTASKLGQDLAKGGAIMATQEVKDAASRDKRLETFEFRKQAAARMGGMDFEYFTVDRVVD